MGFETAYQSDSAARMSRLPPYPELNWRNDGTPEAAAHGDIYYTVESGLEETREVFLKGCGLPERWSGREQFTIAELGFGTGLNFLATWELWETHKPSPTARLHFVSFEGYPLERDDAARALSNWPEITPYTEKLLAKWPHRARGIRRINWPGDGVSLTLHIDDIARALPASRFAADAWFLDGFSPAKNADMWDTSLYPLIAERSAQGTSAGTYTVAGHVRRGLSEAGFEVSKKPGHGRKRERLEAVFQGIRKEAWDHYGIRPSSTPPKRAAILGAGIAGMCLADALSRRGADVSIYDPADELASSASGNPLALVMPRLDAEDNTTARLLIDAYLHARSFYAGLPGAEFGDVRQMPRDEKDAARFAKVLADPPLPLEDLEAIAGGGLMHKNAMILRPKEVIEALKSRSGVALQLGTLRNPAKLLDEGFDAVILANGMAANEQAPWLSLLPKLGQVEHLKDVSRTAPAAIASGHYAITTGTERLWGATFEASGDARISDAARAENDEKLRVLAPWMASEARTRDQTSRASIRATTADRLPIVGAFPDAKKAQEIFAPMAKGQSANAHAPLIDGVYMVTGLGTRGFTWAPWLADILAAQMFGEPAPATQKTLEAIAPMRLLLRAIKRRR